MRIPPANLIIGTVILAFLAGCSEGPFWRTGYISPWARQKWAEEEQISPTLFTKREQLREMVDASAGADPGNQERATQILSDIVHKDQVILMRVEAAMLLGNYSNQTANSALQLALQDPSLQVRLAAIEALENRGDEFALETLASVLARNADLDMRLAATRALANFKDPRAIQALAASLADPDPAMQLRAADSLAVVTDEDFGSDIRAWRQYVDNRFGRPGAQTANRADIASESNDPR